MEVSASRVGHTPVRVDMLPYVLAALGIGILVGWIAARAGERARRRAVEAHCREQVRAVERGRDRYHNELGDARSRLAKRRREYEKTESEVERLRARLAKLVDERQDRTAMVDRLTEELAAVTAVHERCDRTIRELRRRVGELEEAPDRAVSRARRLRFRRYRRT